MGAGLPRSVALATLSLALVCVASASRNYSASADDVMRAQISLMDVRPKDCPPWYGPRSLALSVVDGSS